MQKRGHSSEGAGGPPDKRQRTDPWRKPEDIPSNGGFEEYYKEQGVCPPEVRLTTLAQPQNSARERGRAARLA